MKISVIILCGGNSTRMGIGYNKVFMKIKDKYVLEYSIETFLNLKEVSNIIVVYNVNDIEKIEFIRYKYDNVIFVTGGTTRQESLINGLNNLENGIDKVIVHDGARPFIYLDILKDMVDMCHNKCALVPVRRAVEGVKIVSNNIITGSMNRDNIVFCQTPQIFDADIALKLKNNFNDGIINYLMKLNIEIDVYNLDRNILKITTLDDFYYYKYLIGEIYEKNKRL
jgi:2-C-methyl-D-erythritol 4-phosphate cytidylyltransferase